MTHNVSSGTLSLYTTTTTTQSVRKSVTLSDLEWPLLSNSLKLDPYGQQQKCGSGSLVFGNIWFVAENVCYLWESSAYNTMPF